MSSVECLWCISSEVDVAYFLLPLLEGPHGAKIQGHISHDMMTLKASKVGGSKHVWYCLEVNLPTQFAMLTLL